MSQKFAPPFNPVSPEFQRDPFSTYTDLLSREEPVIPFARGTWLVHRHAEIEQWLRNDRAFIRDRDTALAALPPGAFHDYNYNIMAMMDRPHHASVRKIVAHAFAPRALDRLSVVMAETAETLLDRAEAGEPFDLLNDFAVKLPLFVICDLLGISTEHEDLLKRVSTGLTSASESFATRELREEADTVCRLMHELVEAELAKRGDNAEGDDVLSVLARHKESGEISKAEMFENATFMLAAGHETTTNLIASGIKLLIENPQAMQLMREQPDLIPNAVEEFLRLEPPLHFTGRVAAEDVTISGTDIKAGETVLFGIASGGRDPSVFDNPDALDIERSNAKRHFAFNLGMHTCLGAHLARMEGAAAFKALLDRFDGYEMVEMEPIKPGFIFRGVPNLIVRPN